MADVITTLHPEGAPEDNLYPNVKDENIPSNIERKGDLLWENATPNAEFRPNVIPLSTLPDYDRVLFAFKLNTGNSNASQTLLVFKEVGKTAFLACIGPGGDRWSRRATFQDDTHISFLEGKQDNSENNYACIPLAIYGIK